MRRALLLTALLATSALAESPPHVLIFSGGATRQDAEAALASFKKLEDWLSTAVTLPPGEPRIIESSALPGLKPGFHVVTLGLCRDPAPALAALKTIYPGAYARALTEPRPEACPLVREKPALTPTEPPAKAGPLTLSAFTSEEEGEDDRGNDTTSSTLVFVLVHTPTGQVKDLASVEGQSADVSGDGPIGREYLRCTATLTTEKSAFVVTRACTNDSDACARDAKSVPKAWTETTRVTLKGEAILVGKTKKTITRSSECRSDWGEQGD